MYIRLNTKKEHRRLCKLANNYYEKLVDFDYSEKILTEREEIIRRLKFSQSKEYKAILDREYYQKKYKRLLKVFNYFKTKYPDFTVIDEDELFDYHVFNRLVCGNVSHYLGVITDKILEKINYYYDFIDKKDWCYTVAIHEKNTNQLLEHRYMSKTEAKRYSKNNNDISIMHYKCLLRIITGENNLSIIKEDYKNNCIIKTTIKNPIILFPVVYDNEIFYLIMPINEKNKKN